MRTTPLLFFVLLLAPGAAAEDPGVVHDMLDMELSSGVLDTGGRSFEGCNNTSVEFVSYTNIGDVGYYNVQPRHISAAVNIVGFRGVTMINGTEYICGCPSDLAIVQSSVSTSHAGFEANKDWVRKTTTVVSEGGNTTVALRVDFMWHWTSYSSVTNALSRDYRFESKTVSSTTVHPVILNVSERTPAIAHITMYNNSFEPYTIINVNVSNTTVLTSYSYRNHTANLYHGLGWVNDSRVKYLDMPTWKVTPNQTLLGRAGDSCIIREAPIDLTQLRVRISTPYETENVTRCNITMVSSTPSDYVNFKGILFVVSVIIVLMFVVAVNLRWFTR